MMTTQALVGRFEDDARRYEARPVRLDGQPTWLLYQLAMIYTIRCGKNAGFMHRIVMGNDWSTLNVDTRAQVDDRYLCVAGVGRCYPPRESGAPVIGDRLTDEPWGAGEWLYLWEHAFGALHIYVSHDGRWNHVATLEPAQLIHVDPQLATDIEVREAWVREAP